MSKYNVILSPDGNLDYMLLGASILYDYHPEMRCGFNKRDFLETCIEEMDGAPSVACFQEDTYCGTIVFTPTRRDVHHPGTGRSILAMSTVPGRVGAFRTLLQALEKLIRDEGGSWVSIPKRLSEKEVKIIYRSL